VELSIDIKKSLAMRIVRKEMAKAKNGELGILIEDVWRPAFGSRRVARRWFSDRGFEVARSVEVLGGCERAYPSVRKSICFKKSEQTDLET
jgi:hypothetical protein